MTDDAFLNDPKNYVRIGGVNLPLEPGMSWLQRERAVNRAKKRMKADDRKLARLDAALRKQRAEKEDAELAADASSTNNMKRLMLAKQGSLG